MAKKAKNKQKKAAKAKGARVRGKAQKVYLGKDALKPSRTTDWGDGSAGRKKSGKGKFEKKGPRKERL